MSALSEIKTRLKEHEGEIEEVEEMDLSEIKITRFDNEVKAYL